MSLKDIYILSDGNHIEHILYHIYSTKLNLLGDIFLIQPRYIQNRHQKGYNTIYCLLKNLKLHPLYLMLYKN